jgi:hypothetical protein
MNTLYNNYNNILTIKKKYNEGLYLQEIFKKYDKVLSLGSNCFIKSFLKFNNIDQETHFFDYIGSPMWGIINLFENDFLDVDNIEDYDNVQITPALKIFTNKKYYLRFKHVKNIYSNENSINIYEFNKLQESLKRKIQRIKDIFNSNNKILLLRMEQDNKDRIDYENYPQNNKEESGYIIQFTDMIKRKYPEISFNIIYITSKGELNYDKNNNILTLKNTEIDMNWNDCNEKLTKIFNQDIKFISNSL